MTPRQTLLPSSTSRCVPPSPPPREWERVQAAFGDVPGEEGIVRRCEAYAEYFLMFGKDVRIAEGCRFYHPDRIVLDEDVRMDAGGIIHGSAGVRIGRHARIGARVFIHSAVHETDPNDQRALFERGYGYESVEIGDNCVISANVSILAGTRIAPGAFIECGAVVRKGEYPDGCRIAGVPGQAVKPDLHQPPPAAPSIAIVVPRDSSYRHAAELMIEALGLPQVRVIEDGPNMPRSVHTAVALGPPGWSPGPGTAALPTWTLHDADVPLDGTVEVAIAHDQDNGAERRVRLPHSRLHVVVPAADPARSALENAAALSLYYASKRLRKRRSNLSTAERLETHVALGLLCTLGGADIETLAAEWAAALPDGREQMTSVEHRYLAELGKTRSARLEAYLADVVLDLAKMSDAVRARRKRRRTR